MHQLGDIIVTLALLLPSGFREVPWSICQTAYHDMRPNGARCAIYDPEAKFDLSKLSAPNG